MDGKVLTKLHRADAIADYWFCSRGGRSTGSRSMREGHRFMRGMVQWLGFKTAKVQFLPKERPAGQTKYNLFRLAALASDGIFSFSCAARIATYLGLLAVAIGLGKNSVWLVIGLLSGSAAAGGSDANLAWSYLVITTHFLGGAILCCLGILGEYVGRIFEQVKDRPVYLLKEQSRDPARPMAVPSQRDAA